MNRETDRAQPAAKTTRLIALGLAALILVAIFAFFIVTAAIFTN